VISCLDEAKKTREKTTPSFPAFVLYNRVICGRRYSCEFNQSSTSFRTIFLCQTVTLLDLALELIALSVHSGQIVIGELPHFSLTLPLACFQFPSTRFQSVPIASKKLPSWLQRRG
jgi:hypothetical protein